VGNIWRKRGRVTRTRKYLIRHMNSSFASSSLNGQKSFSIYHESCCEEHVHLPRPKTVKSAYSDKLCEINRMLFKLKASQMPVDLGRTKESLLKHRSRIPKGAPTAKPVKKSSPSTENPFILSLIAKVISPQKGQLESVERTKFRVEYKEASKRSISSRRL
jgi:hypothetical protein